MLRAFRHEILEQDWLATEHVILVTSEPANFLDEKKSLEVVVSENL